MSGHRRIALLILILFTLVAGAQLLRLDTARSFTTDVTELLPADERDPDARLAVSLIGERQARVVLCVLDVPAGTPAGGLDAAAEAYADSLRMSEAFSDAAPLAGQSWRTALGRLVYAKRFELLLPGWLARERAAYAALGAEAPAFPDWLAARTVAAIDARLAAPEGGAMAELLGSDPIGLLLSLEEQAGSLAAEPPQQENRALIWTVTRAGPLSEAGQAPVFAALESAAAAARRIVPQAEARYTGVHRFAATAKASTRKEISTLNIAAIIAVVAVSLLFVRRVLGLLHILPVAAIATLGAAAATTAVFPRVHVLVFALGSLLSGVAVDYTFHIVLARREGESYAGRVRRILRPLLGGAGTSVAGFLALTLSELPLVRQLGVYVAAGVVTGLATTILYLSLFPNLDLRPRTITARLELPRRLRAFVLFASAAAAIWGCAHARWHDDLRRLEFPAPQLRADDAAIRAAFGERDEGSSFITRGGSFAEARARWEAFAKTAPRGAAPASAAMLLPLAADYEAAATGEARDDLAKFADAFAEAAGAADYEPGAFDRFREEFAAYLAAPSRPYETAMAEAADALPGPVGMMVHHDREGAWFISASRASPAAPPPPEGTVSLAGIEGLNQLFSRYRAAAARLSLAGLGVIVVIACALQGVRNGLRTAALPLLSAALAAGLLALGDEPFGLFHLLGVLLGVCLADDYAHFARNDDGSADARASIRLSAATTAASFSVLAFSSIPAVSALGSMVALIVLLALAFVETDLFSLRRHA